MKDPFPKLTGVAGLLLGASVALLYAHRGLTLSHYDAKAHLVVARRILDSLTPEYSQIGAVWLPLPHLLNMLPVQIDWFYRTGASAVAISVLSFGLACYALARIIMQVTGSRVAAAAGVSLFALDPDILYLQSTPMTEPLLFGLTLLSITLVIDWVSEGAEREPLAAGWALVGACLTRYEAWFVMAALVTLACVALLRSGRPFGKSIRAILNLAAYPALAIAAFILHSRFTIGEWFVTGGFFVTDPRTLGRPLASFLQVTWGIRQLMNDTFVMLAVVGLVWTAARGLSSRNRAADIIVLSLAAFLLLPTYAFLEGHPFRMRYMIAPVVGIAVFYGIALGSLRGRVQTAAAVILTALLLASIHPLNAEAPMVQEAQWDRPNSLARHTVTECLMRDYHHEPILASMGSLAHYMQELSQEGLGIRDFVHEGNLPAWQLAVEAPKGQVGSILIEEQAEGGDVLAKRERASSEFLQGFTPVCSGGGVSLFRATENP